MTDEKDSRGQYLPDEERMTTFGNFLRRTSLDEISEVFNILKGDMSFVGPRPLLVEYLEYYNKEQSRRHNVKPGMTGLAQVNGRNDTTWKKRLEFDVIYVDNLSFKLDIKIIVSTILKVLKKEGISQRGHTTMEYFRGTE